MFILKSKQTVSTWDFKLLQRVSVTEVVRKKGAAAQTGSEPRPPPGSSCLALIHTGQPRVSAGSLPTYTHILAAVKAVMNAKYI